MFTKKILYFFIFAIIISCSDKKEERKSAISPLEKNVYDGIGVGPVRELKIENEIRQEMVREGEKIFQAKCISCHNITEERKIGPGLKGVTFRRKPEWIMNQILNPMEMTKNDSLSKELLAIYLSQMTNMELTMNEARSVLEYFRDEDKK